MAAIKTQQAAQVLANPDPRLRAFLFYGPDAGLVAERAGVLAQNLAKREQPPGDIVRLSDDDLETEPDRLMLELGTMPMFGGRRIVRASTGRRINTPLLKSLLAGPQLEGLLIVEAGHLKADDSLRQAFERSEHAASLACYPDEGRDIDAVISEVMSAHKLAISPEARQLLASRLGADRVLSRAEVEKLALYAHGESEVRTEDVEAIVGDASQLALDRILSAAASGNGALAVSDLTRWVASGESAQAVILALDRHFQRLHRVRTTVDRGRPFDDVLRLLRPPVVFKQKAALAAELRLWNAGRLTTALADIARTARAARLAGPLEEAHTERLLLRLAALARGGVARGATRPDQAG